MKANLYTLAYAGVMGTVCALLLTAVASFTGPYRQANEEAEKILNILTALKIPFDADAAPAELLEIAARNISTQKKHELEFYVYSPAGAPDQIEAVAVDFSGPGVWGAIKGILALEADMNTIRGITFYQQQETPGLGGEIATEAFRRQFEGKSITDTAGKPGIVIGAGAIGGNEVEAISGATLTCDKVQDMLNAVIENIAGEKQLWQMID